MEHDRHTYPYKLDFLYQSIAVYAAVLVLYLVVRGMFINAEFPIVWGDPVLYLLVIIVIVSIIALLYNMIMKRRIVVVGSELQFLSAVRRKVLDRSEIESVRFTLDRTLRESKNSSRLVSIRIRDRRRPVRIRPANFEHGNRLIEDLRTWSGELAQDAPRRAIRRRGLGTEFRA